MEVDVVDELQEGEGDDLGVRTIDVSVVIIQEGVDSGVVPARLPQQRRGIE